VAKTKTEEGCLFYGFTRSGDKLHCREAYVDGAATAAHLANVGGTLGAMLESGAAKLDSIEIHGPAEELAKTKEAADPLGAVYFETDADGFKYIRPGAESAKGFCSIIPYFTVADWEAAEPGLAECVAKTKTEEGCLFYGFTRSGDKLHCREAYVDGAATAAHLANVGGTLGAMLESGAAKLDSIEIHGPAEELAKTKEAADPLGAVYFETDADGFSKFMV